MKSIKSKKNKFLLITLLVVCLALGCVEATVCSPTTEPTETNNVQNTIPSFMSHPTTNPTTATTAPPETTSPPASEATQPPTTLPAPTETKEPTPTEPAYTPVNEIVYANHNVNIRIGPGTEYEKVGSLKYGEAIQRIGIGENGWSKVIYHDEIRYISSNYLTTEKPEPSINYPITYSDSTCKITITKEWKYNAWCYIAHLEFTDYFRFGSAIAKNNRGSYETTSSAAKRQNAIFCVNGPYNWGELKTAYAIIRSGVVYHDKGIDKDLCIYNAHTGILMRAEQLEIHNMLASEAAAAGLATDTFKFWNSTLVLNGQNISNADNNSRAQRTFIATNGKPGDIYVIVSEGRYVDNESAGLTKHECAQVVLDLGCVYGVMLDGGGSSTMYFNGKVLNSAAGNERSLVDFVYFRKEQL